MAISVNPMTHVIYVPKADLTLQQSLPEVRELDLNAFRLWLRAWEDDDEGMVQPKTHNHETETLLAGLTYARKVVVLAPYVVEFEDGQYTINCIGANHNLSDVKVANQVSLIVNNAAGLITSKDIEYSSFGGGVTIDAQDVTGQAGTGTLFPAGTARQPCGDASAVPDALSIAEFRGFNKLYVFGNVTFGTGHDIDRKIILGRSHIQNVVTLEDGASCVNSVFREIEVQGVLDGNNALHDCVVGDLAYFSGHVHQCGLKGTIVLAGGGSSVISDCKTIDPFSPPIVDMGDTGQDLAMPGYSGIVTIINLSGAANFVGIGLLGGQVVLDSSSVTGGTIFVSGTGKVIDENGDHVSSGTWNGVTIINDAVNEESVAKANWSVVSYDSVDGFAEDAYPAGLQSHPVSTPANLKTILANSGLHHVHVHGDLTLTGDWSGITFSSDGYERATITLDNTTLERTVFNNLTFGGTVAVGGTVEATKCKSTGVVGSSMDFDDVAMAGTYKPDSGGYLRCDRCSSSEVGGCTIDANGDAVVNLGNVQGIFTILNATAAVQHGVTGTFVLTLHSSVTAGTFFVAGMGIFQDHLGRARGHAAGNDHTILVIH